MIVTNKFNLPQQFVDAVISEEPPLAEDIFSVTETLKGVREIVLSRRHRDEITIDVSDMVWMLFGKAVHSMLDTKKESTGDLVEQRLTNFMGAVSLTGRPDLYRESDQCVVDYKTCSIWKVIHKDFKDWERQIYLYAWLLELNNYEVKRGRVLAFMKDHSKLDAERNKDYPQHPVYVHEFDIDGTTMNKMVDEAIQVMMAAYRLRNVSTPSLPLCSDEQRYRKPNKYAVMKPGRKSAVKLFDTEQDAIEYCTQNVPNGTVVARECEDTKCLRYCMVRQFCDHARSLVETPEALDEGEAR